MTPLFIAMMLNMVMGKRKRKLTAAEKAAKRRRKPETMIIFINGKQKRVKREPTIEGMSVDEFILRNADPIWLHQNEMWEYIQPDEGEFRQNGVGNLHGRGEDNPGDAGVDEGLPF